MSISEAIPSLLPTLSLGGGGKNSSSPFTGLTPHDIKHPCASSIEGNILIDVHSWQSESSACSSPLKKKTRRGQNEYRPQLSATYVGDVAPHHRVLSANNSVGTPWARQHTEHQLAYTRSLMNLFLPSKPPSQLLLCSSARPTTTTAAECMY